MILCLKNILWLHRRTIRLVAKPETRSRTGSKRREREPPSRPSTIGKLRSANGRTTRGSLKTRSTSEQGIERPRTTATTVDLDIVSLTESESSDEEDEEGAAREQKRGVRFIYEYL